MLSLDCFRSLANRGIPIAGIGSFIRLSLVISLRNWSFRLQTSRSIIISTGFAFIAFLRAVLTIYASSWGGLVVIRDPVSGCRYLVAASWHSGTGSTYPRVEKVTSNSTERGENDGENDGELI